MLVLHCILSTAVGSARSFLLNGKYFFLGCARSFRTGLVWVDLAETPRLCSMLEEILSSICWFCSSFVEIATK